MPGSTTRGYEYPVIGDDMGDLPAKVQDLAETVDTQLKRIESGETSSASLSAATNGDVTVTFSAAFAAAPKVIGIARINGSDPTLFPVMLKTVSTTGCVFRVRNGSGGAVAVPVQWIAQG